MKNDKALTKELMKLMNSYCSVNGNSCATLARESGVPYSTVVRLQKGGNVPSFESVFPILLCVMNYSQVMSLVKKYYPVVGMYLDPKGKGGAPMKTSSKKAATKTAAPKKAKKKAVRRKK